MIKSNEEILQQSYEDVYSGQIYLKSQLHHTYRNVTEKAMDIARKDSAVSFLNWKESLGLVRQQRDGIWLINYAMSEWSIFAKDDNELYQKFKEQNKLKQRP